MIKSLSDTRWEAHAAATFAIIKSYNKLLDTLNDISEDNTLKGDARREAGDLLNKMNKLEFALMLVIWNDILQSFQKVSKVLQSEDVTLLTCANLTMICPINWRKCVIISTLLKCALRNFYSYMITRKRIRKKMANDGNAPDVDLSPKDKFRINAFYIIIDKLRI